MIALVTDTTAYLTPEDAQSLGVRIVPHSYFVNGRSFQETFSGCNGSYEFLLRHSHCSTEQCSVSSFLAVFEELLQNGYDVLCMVLSSKLSGACSSARKAAQKAVRNKGGRIQVLDSQTTAGALRFLLKKARNLSFQGLSLEETASALERDFSRTGVVFSVESMDFLRSSGRLGIVRQSVSSLLNRKPLFHLKGGAVESLGTARGSRELLNRFLEIIPPTAKSLTVHHSGNLSSAEGLVSALRKKFPRAYLCIRELGPVLGIHLGSGTLAVAWEE